MADFDPQTFRRSLIARLGACDMEQTHGSWVFLAGDDVYKVKRPVKFPFFDFSTLPLRREDCEREVTLNRRMTPEMYLGVTPIYCENGGYQTGDNFEPGDNPPAGRGEPVEYAVHMTRVDTSRSLLHLVDQNTATPRIMRALAARLVAFHKHCARESAGEARVAAHGSLDTVRGRVEGNFGIMETFEYEVLSKERFRAITSYARAYMDENASLFAERQDGGYIIDGHGDLHLQHIIVDDEAESPQFQIFDCIEFKESFRCGDIALELAFLTMDLFHHHRPDLARQFLRDYASAFGDPNVCPEGLHDFYACYRACVRAKVLGILAHDDKADERVRARAGAEAASYCRLAEYYATREVHAAADEEPALILVGGLPATGKSALAREILGYIPAAYLASDRERKLLAGLSPFEAVPADLREGLYSHEMSERVYKHLLTLADHNLEAGRSVVLDATFLDADTRRKVHNLGRQWDARIRGVRCTAPEEVIRERLVERAETAESERPSAESPHAHSDATLAVYESMRGQSGPWTEFGAGEYFEAVLDTPDALEKTATAVVER